MSLKGIFIKSMKLKWMEKRELSKEKLGYLLVIPALSIVGCIYIYPVATTIWYSLHSIRLNVPHLGTPWVGLQNYVNLFHYKRFLYSFKFTLLFASFTVAIQLIFGLGVALTVHKNFRGRGAIRAIIISPWAFSLVVASLMWKWMYNASYGVINSVFMQFGLLDQPFDWLGDSTLSATLAALIAVIWRNTPFAAIVLLTGLQSIHPEMYEAARIDGGNKFQIFQSITLPLLKPAILMVLLFQSIDGIRAFDLMYALTLGGPGNATELASLFVYKFAFSFLDFGRGAAAAMVLALLTVALCFIYMRLLLKQETF